MIHRFESVDQYNDPKISTPSNLLMQRIFFQICLLYFWTELSWKRTNKPCSNKFRQTGPVEINKFESRD